MEIDRRFLKYVSTDIHDIVNSQSSEQTAPCLQSIISIVQTWLILTKQSSVVSHWLGANLESVLTMFLRLQYGKPGANFYRFSLFAAFNIFHDYLTTAYLSSVACELD